MHLKYDCPKRRTKCELCQQTMTAGELPYHKSSRCAKRVVRCINAGCGSFLVFAHLENHLRYECGNNMVSAREKVVDADGRGLLVECADFTF